MKLLLLVGLLLLASSASAENIVVIIIDDIGVDRVDKYGYATSGPTPVMDSLADEGVRFTKFWATPGCSPSRASFLVGLNPENHGVGIPINPSNPDRYEGLHFQPTIASALRDAGWRTSMIGKWHVAGGGILNCRQCAVKFGFDYYDISYSNVQTQFNGISADGTYTSWERCNAANCWEETTYSPTAITNAAITQLSGTEPFFLVVAYHSAHNPFHCPDDALHSYGATCGGSPTDATLHKAMTEALDTEIGRLLAPIDRDDTTIFLVGENGSPAATVEAPFTAGHAKGTVYEGGVRIPLIVAGVQVPVGVHGDTADGIVQMSDFFATLAAIPATGDTAADSVSFLPLLSTPSDPSDRTYTYTSTFEANQALPADWSAWDRAARDTQYKLLRLGTGTPTEEFYDLDADEHEVTDLIPGGLSAPQQTAYDALTIAMDAEAP